MCGVILVYSKEPLKKEDLKFLELRIKHRGQDNTGICTLADNCFHILKGKFLPEPEFDLGNILAMSVRYATSGGKSYYEWTPSVFSGNINNVNLSDKISANDSTVVLLNGEAQHYWIDNYLNQKGANYKFKASNDTARLAALIQYLTTEKKFSLSQSVKKVLANVKGAYSIIVMKGKKAVAARGMHGTRPLELLITDKSICLSSETQVFDLFDKQYHLHLMNKNPDGTYPYNFGWRRVYPGELIELEEGRGVVFCDTISNKNKVIKKPSYKYPYQCIFDLIYFAHPTGYCFGIPVMKFRGRLGKYLSPIDPVVDDPLENVIISGVPNSGRNAAVGYADEHLYNGHKFKLREVLIAVPNTFRTFIEPNQDSRLKLAYLKYVAASYVVPGKEIVIIDDSLVRSTTARFILSELLAKGARRVHFKLTAPPLRYPCYYGIDMKNDSDFFAKGKTEEQILEGLIEMTNHTLKKCGLEPIASKDNITLEYMKIENLVKCANSFYFEDYMHKKFPLLTEYEIKKISRLAQDTVSLDALINKDKTALQESKEIFAQKIFESEIKPTSLPYNQSIIDRAFEKLTKQRWCLSCFTNKHHTCVKTCKICDKCAKAFK